jgi:calcium-dependent protein kinase
LNHNWIR